MIILFCGIPGVGKSTIANNLEEKLKEIGSTRLIVSDDISTNRYQKIFKRIEELKDEVDYLILDATFFKKEWRNKVYELAKNNKVLTVYLKCPFNICIKRNKSRRNPIPEKALYIMNEQFEIPENPDVAIGTSKKSNNEIVSELFSIIKNI